MVTRGDKSIDEGGIQLQIVMTSLGSAQLMVAETDITSTRLIGNSTVQWRH